MIGDIVHPTCHFSPGKPVYTGRHPAPFSRYLINCLAQL